MRGFVDVLKKELNEFKQAVAERPNGGDLLWEVFRYDRHTTPLLPLTPIRDAPRIERVDIGNGTRRNGTVCDILESRMKMKSGGMVAVFTDGDLDNFSSDTDGFLLRKLARDALRIGIELHTFAFTRDPERALRVAREMAFPIEPEFLHHLTRRPESFSKAFAAITHRTITSLLN